MPATPPAQADQPFLSSGDVIALVALVVGLLAALFAYLTWRTSRTSAAASVRSASASERSADEAAKSSIAAERSASAAENAVTEQRTANALTLAQQRRDEEEHAAAVWADRAHALAEAGRIIVRCSPGSGVDVVITNGSGGTVEFVRLVGLTGDPPTWSWVLNTAIAGNTDVVRQLAPRAEAVIRTVFRDEHGEEQRSLQPPYRTRVRFTDAGGRRWEITEGVEPHRVDKEDIDLEQRRRPASGQA